MPYQTGIASGLLSAKFHAFFPQYLYREMGITHFPIEVLIFAHVVLL
jgi:hypothetical protein